MEDTLTDPSFYEWAVMGADGFITDNIQKSLHLANGSQIEYHSIVPADKQQAEFIQAQMDTLPSGHIIHLDKPPLAINVVLVDEEERNGGKDIAKWKDFTIVPGRVVIPIQACRTNHDWARTIIPGSDEYLPSRVELKNNFPLELAFAITMHKAQGRTLSKVILALSDRGGSSAAQLTYASLYVALNRVKKKRRQSDSYQWQPY